MTEPKKHKKRGRKSKKEKEALLKAQQEGLIEKPVKKNKKIGFHVFILLSHNF